MQAWNVYVGTKLFDTVYFQDGIAASYVTNSLIDHDGYPANINVVKEVSQDEEFVIDYD